MKLRATVMAIGLVGAGLAMSTRGAESQSTPAVPGRIVFQSDVRGDWDIYAINDDGFNRRAVSGEKGSHERNPSWGPASVDEHLQRVGFQSDRDGDDEIYTVALDGSGLQQLTHNNGADADPAWSPDGATLAFVATRSGATDLYVINADGSGERRLTRDARVEAAPAWSPDSRRLVFARESAEDSDLFVIRREGGVARSLTSGDTVDGNPSWFRFRAGTATPVEQVVFDRLRPDSGDYEVTTVDVTTGLVLRSLTASRGLDTDPTWSPDGGRIAYASNRDGRLQIYVMANSGRSQTRLTVSRTNDAEPEFQKAPVPPPGVPPPPPPIIFSGGGSGCTGGGGGNNKYDGGAGPDNICGGPGRDRIRGLRGKDNLYGDDGKDKIRGGPGKDYLDGKDGYSGDVLRGEGGRDTGVWDPGDTHMSVARR